VEGPREKDNF